MATRVQFNPSTLKASWDPVSNKVQVVVPFKGECSGCTLFGMSTPEFVHVTLSGVTACPDCFYNVALDRYYKYSFIGTINKTWILRHDSYPPYYGCRWTASASDIWRLTYYTDGGCLSYHSHIDFGMDMYVEKYLDAPSRASVQFYKSTREIFRHFSYTPTSKCLEISGLATQLNCAAENHVSDSGIATIVEA